MTLGDEGGGREGEGLGEGSGLMMLGKRHKL